jgi:replication factor C large subunit
MTLPWIQKYAPKSTSDIVGPGNVIANFIENHSKQKKKALLLYGPSGTGKTSAAYAFTEYEIVEINASDERNKDQIELRLGNALHQQSLFGLRKLILIDDIDGLSGKDRGGVAAIAKLIENPAFPVIITSQDPFSSKLSTIRSRSSMLEFPPVSEALQISILKTILDAEKISYAEKDLLIVVQNTQGDLRAAINDVQMLSTNGVLEIPAVLAQRLHRTDVKDALRAVFKKEPVLSVFDTVSEDYSEILLWLDYNMPLEYQNAVDRARAYGCLTKADVFLSRIKRRQHWRFLVYVNALLSAGIASSKDTPYMSNLSYTQTTRLLKIWQANRKNELKKSISQKIATKIHTSTKRVIRDFDYYRSFSDAFELDDAEKAFMTHR